MIKTDIAIKSLLDDLEAKATEALALAEGLTMTSSREMWEQMRAKTIDSITHAKGLSGLVFWECMKQPTWRALVAWAAELIKDIVDALEGALQACEMVLGDAA